MKQNIILGIILTICLVFSSCKKDEVVPITSLSVDDMEIKTTYTTADIVWSVKSEATINEAVLEYSTDPSFTLPKQVRMAMYINKCTVSLDSLKNGTTYYIRCKAINKINSTTSKTDSLRTLPYQLAKINTDSITQISVSTATLHGTLVNLGSDQKTSVGFYFASHTDVSVEDSCIIVEVSELKDSIHYSYSLSNLVDNITYYVRSFARNVKGVSLGEELSFITKEVFLPEVAPTIIAYVSYTDVICKSEVISDGGGDIIERGFWYSTTPNPTLANEKKVSGNGKGVFSASISNLTANTTYYIRAFARNSKGTTYGEQAEFKTKEYTLPSVSTSVTTKVKYTTATCGGNVSDDGGQEVTDKGICYSTSQYPTVSDYKVSCGSGIGDFECDLSNLSEGTTYYVRTYAINSVGINYGDQSSFVTKEHLPNAIYYYADQKLTETADNSRSGLHIYRFNETIISHTFEDGEGVVLFNGTLSSIGEYAFYKCSNLTSVILPNGVTSIGDYSFSECSSLLSVELPNGLITIGNYAFFECYSLNTIIIPFGVVNIGSSAFAECTNLVSVSIPDGVTSIGSSAFAECTNLASIEIPGSISIIEYKTFYNCTKLANVIMYSGIIKIQQEAFRYCSSIQTLDLPSSVTYLGDRTFQYCSGITTIVCRATTPPTCHSEYGSYTFSDVSRAALLYVPATSLNRYKNAYVWREFYNIFPISE